MKWQDYPPGTKAHSINGGYWEKVTKGWKWLGGNIFPAPGGDASRIVIPENLPDLHLNLKRDYWFQIESRVKPEEYRLKTNYWAKRLVDRNYNNIIIKRGYPSKGDTSKILTRPWLGYTVRTITHPHFGPNPVEVFAIKVN